MTKDSLPEQFPAWAAWSSVTEADKAEVARLAKQGQPHPDRRVEQAACGWAEVLLGAAEVEHQDRWWNRLFAPLEPLFGLDDWLERRADTRWARRVLRASGHQPK